MNTKLLPRLGATALALALSLSLPLRAADHLDGPAASADPAADITDVFAWTSADGTRVNLVMDVFPAATSAAKFSNTVQYVFHTSSRAAFGQAVGASEDIVCTFDSTQAVSCWAGTEYLHGDASKTAGLASASGRLQVFAGLRDDPFFFNLDGFKDVVATVKTLAHQAGGPPFPLDAATCPDLSGKPAGSTQTYQQILLDKLTHTSGGPPVDHFKGLNVLAIVLSVDKTLLDKGGPVISVWGSTNRAP